MQMKSSFFCERSETKEVNERVSCEETSGLHVLFMFTASSDSERGSKLGALRARIAGEEFIRSGEGPLTVFGLLKAAANLSLFGHPNTRK